MYYRNKAGHAYSDYDTEKVAPGSYSTTDKDGNVTNYDETIHTNLPIYKNIAGKREVLPEKQQINSDKIVRLLNIKAIIDIETPNKANATDAFYNYKAGYSSNTTLVNFG